VASAGDVDGDGYADVVVGAPFYDNGQSNEGRAYVYLGAAGGLGLTPEWTAESNQAVAQFGYSVATAGDVNGDGYADVIIGAHYYDNPSSNEAGVRLSRRSRRAVVDGGLDRRGQPGGGHLCRSVATAGDVNGDGYADVIVGAPLYDGGQKDEGRAYVYHGSAGGLGLTPAGLPRATRRMPISAARLRRRETSTATATPM